VRLLFPGLYCSKIDNESRSFEQILRTVVRSFSQTFRIPVIDKNCLTARGMATINVAPAIADREAALKIDIELSRRAL
jgi:hypothetical protein